MSALPSEISPMAMIEADNTIDNVLTELRPINATGVNLFGEGNNKVVFQIPAYANSFINTKRTFLSFKGRVKKANGSDATDGARFTDNMPIIERYVLRAGNGLVLSDTQDYHVIERILSNMDSMTYKETMGDFNGDYKASVASDASNTILDKVYDEHKVSTMNDAFTFQKELVCGILGKTQKSYVPIGLYSASGGWALQLEFYLNKREIVCRHDKSTTEDVDYELNDFKLMLEIVRFEDELMRKFNSAILSGNAVALPYRSFRLHKSTMGTNSSLDLAISESAHNLDKVYTAIMPVQKRQTRIDTTAAATSAVQHKLNDSIALYGGVGEQHRVGDLGNLNAKKMKVKSYQWRYLNKYYPPHKVETAENDTTMAYLTSLSEADGLMNNAFISRRMSNGERIHEHNFVICQSFKTYKDPRVINGLNTSATSAPLQLSLELERNANSASENLEIVSFVESVHSVRIQQGGATSIIEAV